MNDSDERAFVIDHTRGACLCDVGEPKRHATLIIGPDGTEHAAIIDLSTGPSPIEFACPDAPHEQLGPIPDAYAHRLHDDDQ